MENMVNKLEYNNKEMDFQQKMNLYLKIYSNFSYGVHISNDRNEIQYLMSF
jgi:hypothetical protein